MPAFHATLQIIGINPYVSLPEKVLIALFKKAKKEKGPIPVTGTVNRKRYRQTLVKFRGAWRLYINTIMLKDSPKRIGESLTITITFDPSDREIEAPALFTKALRGNRVAKAAFDRQTPSRKREIVRYLAHLKTEESLQRNVTRAIEFLTGAVRFVGRDKP